MRTTLTLDEDVVAKLQVEMRRSGRPFKEVVNEFLRIGLTHRRAVKAAEPFKVEPLGMGPPLPGRSYDNVGGLLEEIEGAGHR